MTTPAAANKASTSRGKRSRATRSRASNKSAPAGGSANPQMQQIIPDVVSQSMLKATHASGAAAWSAYLHLGEAWVQFHRLASTTLLVRSLLVAVVALVYAESLSGGFVYDDAECLNHGAVTGELGLWSLFTTDFWGKDLGHVESHRSWRPLTTLLFRTLHSSGNSAAVFHGASLLAYAGVVCMVHELARRVLRDARAAFVGSLLFAVHPVHVEAVANVTNLAELLSALLFLGAVLVYTSAVVPGRRSDVGYELALALGASAMLAKESGITALGVTLVYDLVGHVNNLRPVVMESLGYEAHHVPAAAAVDVAAAPTAGRRAASADDDDEDAAAAAAEAAAAAAEARRVAAVKAEKQAAYNRRVTKRVLRRVVATLGTLVVAILFRLIFLRGSAPSFPRHMNHVAHDPSWLSRTLTLAYLPAAHLWTLLMPSNLCHDWSFDSIPMVRSIFDTRFLGACVLYYALFLLVRFTVQLVWPTGPAALGFKADTSQVASAFPATAKSARADAEAEAKEAQAVADALRLPLVMGLAILVLPFLPASNLFFYVGFILADRVLFLPSVGFCLLVATAVVLLNKHMESSQNTRSRWRRTRLNVLRGGVALLILAVAVSFATQSFQRTRDWASDESLTQAGLRVNPGNAKLWYNHGVMAMGRGDVATGVADHKKAILMWRDYSDALMALSTHYYNNGDLDRAFSYAQAIARTELPVGDLGKVLTYGAAFTRLAEITEKRDLPAEALYDKAFEIFHRDHAVLRKIALAYVDINNVPKAVRYLKAVYESDNTDWHVADVLTKLHVDTDLSAAEQWAYAAFKAGSPNALFNLGRVQQLMYERQQSGDVREGERRISPSDVELWYRRSLEQSPKHYSTHRWLAHTLQFHVPQKNLTGAVHHYREFLKHDASDYRCNVNMGAILLDLGIDMGEAERCFRRALNAEHASVASMANLGRIMHKRGRSQEAADFLYASLEKYPTIVDARPSAESSVSDKDLHNALAVVWASVANRQRVEYHCGHGTCDADATLRENQPANAQQQ